MTAVEQRPSFFEGQYLEAGDLAAVVDYARAQSARHALGAHRWGIALGLELREVPGPNNTLEVFVQPGYAWDGFGRSIVVPEPHKLTGAEFATIDTGFVPGNPPQVVEVWLGYRETMTRGPRPGFENCEQPSAFARVAESYRVEVGRRPTIASQRDPIEIAGRSMDAAQALTQFDPLAPEIVDASVPHQVFAAVGDTARWLVPIGVVLWEPGNPGRFRPRDAAALNRNTRSRQYCGVAAGSIEATGGHVRVHDRAKGYGPFTDELLWVEGDLRIDGDARVYGHRLQFARTHTESPIAPFHLLRQDDPAAGVKLQVVIGDQSAGANRFAVGRQTAGATATAAETDAEAFVVTDKGNVGIGTSTPKARLHLTEDGLEIGTSATPEDNFYIQSNTDGPRGLRIYNKDVGAGTHVASFTQSARLGIGTTDPSHLVHVQGNLGLRQNKLYLSGGDRDWSSVSYNAHRTADGANWAFPDPSKPAVTIEMDSADNTKPRFEVWSTLPGANSAWRSRFKVFGHTGDIGMAGIEGNVGIGTYSPAAKLDVRGEIQFGWPALRPVGAAVGLRVVVGNVRSDGTIAAGDNYVVARLGPGRYVVTWLFPFPGMPTVVVTKVWGQFDLQGLTAVDPRQNAIVDEVNTAIAVICTGDEDGNLVDSNFCFLALGPR